MGVPVRACMVTPPARSPEVVAATIERHGVELLPTSPTFLNLLLLSEVVSLVFALAQSVAAAVATSGAAGLGLEQVLLERLDACDRVHGIIGCHSVFFGDFDMICATFEAEPGDHTVVFECRSVEVSDHGLR